jgi:hypothetical protein
MVNVALSIGQIVLALFLVALNGFFVAAEFAFVRVRGTAVNQLVDEGRTGAGSLQDVMDDLDNYLATTQLGITIASLGLGWVGEPAVAALIEPVLASVLPQGLIHAVAFAIGFSIITFLHVVFGELAPKTIAIAQTERLSLFLAPPMKLSYLILYPGIVVFNGAANTFTRSLGVPPASELDETLGEQEIRRVLAQSGEAGDIDELTQSVVIPVADERPRSEAIAATGFDLVANVAVPNLLVAGKAGEVAANRLVRNLAIRNVDSCRQIGQRFRYQPKVTGNGRVVNEARRCWILRVGRGRLLGAR